MNSDVKHKKNIRFVALKVWELLFIKKNKLSDIFRNDKSFNSLNKLILNSLIIPVAGTGKYLQTVCFGEDLGKFIKSIVIDNLFLNKITNFYSGELINYNEFLSVILKFKNTSLQY